MEKAFDFGALKDELVKQGLPAIEGLAELVAKAVFDWSEQSVAIHPNAYVKAIGLPAIAILKPLALNAIDHIDGVDDNGDGKPAAE